jgi:hypothetical protein
MGKGKHLIIAVVLLGGLVAAALLLQRDPFKQAARQDLSGVLPSRAEGSIDRIAVTNREGSLVVEKRGGNWWLIEPKELRADDTVINSAAAALEKLSLTDVVSRKKERQGEYGLSKEMPEYLEMKAYAGGQELLGLAAGKRTPDMQGTFILLAKEPDTVYSASALMPPVFSRGIQDWRSKLVLDLPQNSIEEIQMVTEKGSLVLVKEGENSWHKKDDPNWHADKVRLGSLMSSFTRLSWTQIVDEPVAAVDYGFQKPAARVTVTAGGLQHVLTFGNETGEGPGNVWLKVEGDPKVYQIRKPLLERFTKDFEFYRGEAEPPPQGTPGTGSQ